jgi:hypothetical protein
MFSCIRKATMFTLVLAFGAALGVSARQTQAAPLSFDIAGAPLSSASATLGRSLCFGCSIGTALNSALDSIAFTLNPGQSTTFDFFRVSVGGFGGAFASVTATLGFDSPSGASVSGHGSGGFITKFGIVSAGFLLWDDVPAIVTGADGSQFSVDFSDIAGFTFGNSADVTATITALKSGTPTVPPVPATPAVVAEPGTIVLLSLGLVAIACRRRVAAHCSV